MKALGERPSDERTVLQCRHVLERHKRTAHILQTINGIWNTRGVLLKSSTLMDANLNGAPSFTKNSIGERGQEMRQGRKGQQWYVGIKCHIGVDIDSGQVRMVRGISGSLYDVMGVEGSLRDTGREVYADASYIDACKCPNNWAGVKSKRAKRRDKGYKLDLIKLIFGFGSNTRSVRSSTSSTTSRSTSVGSITTQRNCIPCLRWLIYCWCEANRWAQWLECVGRLLSQTNTRPDQIRRLEDRAQSAIYNVTFQQYNTSAYRREKLEIPTPDISKLFGHAKFS